MAKTKNLTCALCGHSDEEVVMSSTEWFGGTKPRPECRAMTACMDRLVMKTEGPSCPICGRQYPEGASGKCDSCVNREERRAKRKEERKEARRLKKEKEHAGIRKTNRTT